MMFLLLTVAVEPLVFSLAFKDCTGARNKNFELHYNSPPAVDHRDNPQSKRRHDGNFTDFDRLQSQRSTVRGFQRPSLP